MFFLLCLCCFVEGFSGGSTTHVGIIPTRAVPLKSSLDQFFFLFHGDWKTLPVRKKKKKKEKKKGKILVVFWCSVMLAGLFCGCRRYL